MIRIKIFLLVLNSVSLHVVVNSQHAQKATVPRHLCGQNDTGSASGDDSDNALKPDHFRKLGRVADMKSCIKHCCDLKSCDLAMMSFNSKQCYAVACFDENLCSMLPSYPARVSFDVAHVKRK